MNQVSRKAVVDTAAIPPIRCASWCTDGTGHTDAGHVEDQWCSSAAGRVVVSSVEPWLMSDGSTQPATASVRASQDQGEPAHVVVVDTQDRGTKLTPEEARELADLLNHFAWVAEQDQVKRNAFEIGAESQRMGLLGQRAGLNPDA